MTKADIALFDLLRAVLHEEKPADPNLAAEEWEELLRLSERHKLLPLILDAACTVPSYRASTSRLPKKSPSTNFSPTNPSHAKPSPWGEGVTATVAPDEGPSVGGDAHITHQPASSTRRWKEIALDQTARQALQENEFLNLALALQECGLDPVVMKGPVCRALYPKPLLRPSVDDDLLIPDDQVRAYHAAFLEFGLTSDETEPDLETAWELSYHKPDSPLYIELHKQLFDPGSDAFNGFNTPFDGALDRAVPVRIQDVTLKTLAPTDHLLFLILHAFKHFLYSGFGVRIVSDICLYSRRYAEEIDFEKILAFCREHRCDRFTAAVYRIGMKYLGLPVPDLFAAIEVDESELLADILDSGLVGAEIDRLHSANITLGAVADQNTGKTRSGGLSKTLFPSAKKLSGRYPWLEKRPWLLPAAWACRIGSYLKSREKYGEQSPAASLRIGKERVKLLETYGVIDK